jgi:DNA-binding NarL/FixJ family response regulator
VNEALRIRVLVVDDHPKVRQSLRRVLSAAPHIEVVGEAADGEEALRVCGELHPEVVLMDLRLPGLDGVSAIRALQGQEPVPQVVVLTTFYDEQLIPQALAAGAGSYVLKVGAIDELLAAIRAAHEREQAR